MVGSRGSGFGTLMLAAAAAAAAVAMIGAPAWANEMRRFDIPGQDMAGALEAFGRQSDQDVVFDAGQLRGKRAPAVIGLHRPDDALQRLLYRSGLAVRRVNATSVIVETSGPQGLAAVAAAEPAIVEELVVTGTRIRGAPPASPVTIVTANDMRNAGQQDLGEAARSLPQNFSGGQNPGAGSRSGATSGNSSGGASTLNLRGLGNDATLTLLNGHRLTFNGLSGADITAVPAAAVERLEILTDGASALYGSDAVGGVANIIVRPKDDALTVRALYGGSTDGGNLQHQYELTGQTVWDGGGVLLTLVSRSKSAIWAKDRSYTRTMNPETSIYPRLSRRNALVSAYQALGPHLRVAIDGLYNRTRQESQSALTTAPLRNSGNLSHPRTRSFLLAPSLELDLPGDWLLSAYATYGEDELTSSLERLSGGRLLRTTTSCYCNVARSGEVSVEGPLIDLPAGPVRLAAGGGYRTSRTAVDVRNNGVHAFGSGIVGRDSVSYGFGELSLPLIAADQNIPLIRTLRASLALRYEDYAAFGSVTTPKIGLIQDVTSTVTLKASWGRSFKAPTFAQRYQEPYILVADATGYGDLFPTTATYLSRQAGNPDLKPERATSTTLTAEWRPSALPGLQLGVSYYHIAFRDRVTLPFTIDAGVITNPLYQAYVTRNPSAAAQAAAIAQSPSGLLVGSTRPYDPADVVALIDGRYTNATRQTVEGVDLALRYDLRLASGDSVTLSSTATYLDLTQQLLPGTPTFNLAGNFYQPRHFVARSGATWTHQALTLAAFVNHTGAARYRAVNPIVQIKPVTSADLVVNWRAPRPLGMMLSLAVINAFNVKPTRVPGSVFESSYDATAYSAAGRIVTLALTKTW